MAEPILIAQDLQKSFGDTHAVKGISLQVARGEVFGLLGPGRREASTRDWPSRSRSARSRSCG